MSYLAKFTFLLFGVTTYSMTELLALVLLLSVGGAVLGYITDAIMGEHGFGPAGNGFLAVFGAVIGIHYRNLVLGPVASEEAVLIAVSAAASATAALLIVGIVKRRLVA